MDTDAAASALSRVKATKSEAADCGLLRRLGDSRTRDQALIKYLAALYRSAAAFPSVLVSMIRTAPDDRCRWHLVENLLAEQGLMLDDGGIGPAALPSHADLLIPLYRRLRLNPPSTVEPGDIRSYRAVLTRLERDDWLGAAALVLVGIESNSPVYFAAIRQWFVDQGFAPEELVFFSEHIEADVDHGETGIRLVADLVHTQSQLEHAMRSARIGRRVLALMFQ